MQSKGHRSRSHTRYPTPLQSTLRVGAIQNSYPSRLSLLRPCTSIKRYHANSVPASIFEAPPSKIVGGIIPPSPLPVQWSERRPVVLAFLLPTFESLLLSLLLLRLDGVEDGRPDEKIGESSDDQAEGPHVLLLHPTTRQAPRPARTTTAAAAASATTAETSGATSVSAAAAAAVLTGALIPTLMSAVLLRSATRSSTAKVAVADYVGVGTEAE